MAQYGFSYLQSVTRNLALVLPPFFVFLFPYLCVTRNLALVLPLSSCFLFPYLGVTGNLALVLRFFFWIGLVLFCDCSYLVFRAWVFICSKCDSQPRAGIGYLIWFFPFFLVYPHKRKKRDLRWTRASFCLRFAVCDLRIAFCGLRFAVFIPAEKDAELGTRTSCVRVHTAIFLIPIYIYVIHF